MNAKYGIKREQDWVLKGEEALESFCFCERLKKRLVMRWTGYRKNVFFEILKQFLELGFTIKGA